MSDLDGFFVFTNVPVGSYELQSAFIGYDTLLTAVTLQADQVKYLKLLMVEGSIQLQTINVSASLEQRRNEVNVSRITVTPKQIKALPSTGGEADIAQDVYKRQVYYPLTLLLSHSLTVVLPIISIYHVYINIRYFYPHTT